MTPSSAAVLPKAVDYIYWWPKGCPEAVIPLFALELLIPGLHLGQEGACRLVSEGLRGGFFQTLRSIFQIGGAAMTAVLVTTLTGILRRD